MLRERFFLTAALLTLNTGTTLLAQDKALPCLLNADFESGLPAGWDIGAPVEVVGGSGATVEAWRVATASEANANGFFPVPDQPYNGRFVMANDDAPPCDCNMGSVVLTAPAVDLTAVNGAVLHYRAFHDGNFGGGPALVEASTDGSTWTRVDSIPSVSGAWQQRFVDLGGYDGSPSAQLRFRWSDNGQWASGLALDDICVRGRLNDDLTLVEAFVHDPEPSPFNTNVRSLRYTELPLQQAEALTVAASVRNSGRNMARQIRVSVSIAQNGNTAGPFTSAVLDSLLPGDEAVLRVATGWTPTAVGELQISYTAEAQTVDEDALDNSAVATMRITGPGWADGYGALGSASGPTQGSVGGNGVFVILARAELAQEERIASGISASLGYGSTEGTTVRALILDADLSFVDSSARRTITAEDIQRIASGEPLFFPLVGAASLSGDVYFGIQSLREGDRLEVQCAGSAPVGAALTMQGIFLDVDHLPVSPALRLHFEQVGVGIDLPPSQSAGFRLHQVLDKLELEREEANDHARVRISDASGRLLQERSMAAGQKRVSLPLSPAWTGVLMVELITTQGRNAQRVAVSQVR
ncbi:MAG: hypothetical protein R2817_05575 [Flavobacteriales bacterium]